MKKWLIISAVVVGVIFALIAGAALWGAHAAQDLLKAGRHDIAGLTLDIGGSDISWKSARLILKDIKIYPIGKVDEKDMLASAGELSVRVALFEILHGKLHFKEIELFKPKINYFITGKKTSNWDALQLVGNKNEGDVAPAKDSKESSWKLIIDNVVISDGEVAYKDQVKGQRLNLSRVNISIDDLSPSKVSGEMPTEFEMKAGVGGTGGTIWVKGKGDLLGEAINFELNCGLSSTPLGAFSSFYAGSVPFPIVAGSISASGHGVAKQNMLSLSAHASISGLRVGGGIKGDLINKYILSTSGPIGLNASVSGDLSTGDLSVSTAITKNFAAEIMKKAMAAAPGIALDVLEKVAPPVLKKLPIPKPAVEKGVKGILKGF